MLGVQEKNHNTMDVAKRLLEWKVENFNFKIAPNHYNTDTGKWCYDDITVDASFRLSTIDQKNVLIGIFLCHRERTLLQRFRLET